MKVLVVTTSYPRFDGDLCGHFVASACEAVARRGNEVCVLAPHAQGLPLEEVTGGVKIKRFCYGPEIFQKLAYGSGIPDNLRSSCMAWVNLPGFLHAMRKSVIAEADGYDVIHAHWAICGFLARAGAASSGSPLVLSLRGSDMADNSVARYIAGKAIANAAQIVCVSGSIMHKALSLGANQERCCVLENGLDFEMDQFAIDKSLQRQKLGLPDDGKMIVSVGRLAKVKGYDILIRAFAEVLNMDKSLRLALVGGGVLAGELSALAKELGVEERVHFAGEIPRNVVHAWLAAADVFCLSSLSEGRSNALLEAMAAGLACVATDVGGVREMTGGGALIAEVGSESSIADCLVRVISDEELCADLKAKALEKVSTMDLSWDSHGEKLERIYSLALQLKRG